jgi:hypothetical protein
LAGRVGSTRPVEVEVEYGFRFEGVSTRRENGMDGTDGIVVANGAVNDAQVTIHLDHSFFDTFAVDDASLHFEPMAARHPHPGRSHSMTYTRN